MFRCTTTLLANSHKNYLMRLADWFEKSMQNRRDDSAGVNRCYFQLLVTLVEIRIHFPQYWIITLVITVICIMHVVSIQKLERKI